MEDIEMAVKPFPRTCGDEPLNCPAPYNRCKGEGNG